MAHRLPSPNPFGALSEMALPVEELLEIAVGESTEYLEVGLREERLAETARLLGTLQSKTNCSGVASTAADASIYIERAMDLGAVAINLHLGHAYMSEIECVELLSLVQEQAEHRNIPLLVETHRGRMTQDLYRTSHWISRCQGACITLDVSHYIVAGEGLGGHEEDFFEHLDPLLQRTALIHGRISNGQTIQVSDENRNNTALRAITLNIWRQAMECWLRSAPDDGVFVFEPELGPPPYAWTTVSGNEMFSRIVQSRRLVEAARECWNLALSSPGYTSLLSKTNSFLTERKHHECD